MIEFDNVTFCYTGSEKHKSLNDFSLSVNKGECVLLCGPSGCGKSTVTRMVNGLIPHFYSGKIEGNVKVNGKVVANEELYDMAGMVGTVFQNPRSQFFNIDTTSELVFGCENMGMKEDEILTRVERTVKQSKIQNLIDRNIFNLSGGEKQKIACASIMTSSPEVIILDEPSANLDYDSISDLQNMIEIWKELGKTILIAEHRLTYCLPYVDSVVIMENGSIVNKMPKETFVRYSNDMLHEMGLRSIEIEDVRKLHKQKSYKEVMTVRNLIFGYKDEKKILNFEKVDIPIGEIVALVGANGAGKTTFLRCISGIEKKCKAVLDFNNKRYKAKQRLKLMYLVMQDVNHQLFSETVLDEVLISMKDENEEKALQILESLDLMEFAGRHPLSLSGGQKQRVAVASAIASEREIILFDEPTSGLDYRHMLQVAEILRELKKSGKTVIIVTHDTELVENCDANIIHLEELRPVTA